MGHLLNIITPLHKKSKRNYLERMVNDKVHCSEVARQYGFDYWDGDRKYGYGGYMYDGRWETVARSLIDHYRLPKDAKILDVGCGKGFLLYEFKKLLPQAAVVGIDISDHALQNAKEEVKPFLRKLAAQDKYPFADKEFDLVFSNTTLHNLYIFELQKAVREIERVGKNKFICVESYRNIQELFNVQCWALTCNAFFSDKEWQWFYESNGYTGDFEFIYFE
ncbi:MAG: methyltransferase domain-containing protein [Candidatus Omnitrophica bacterium]|nr:methyltransferase domain-containing protein [Candidatus Omnitrophota bacterium]MDE2223602.1 methyltransferase domain-containing protein [Candidatus Omnitrophota bacterium]